MTLIKRITSILALGPVIALALPLVLQPATALGNSEPDDSGTTVTKKKGAKTILKGTQKDGKKAKRKLFAIKCIKGKIWDNTKRRCVAEEESSSLDHNSIYSYGRNLARAGLYHDALRVLYLAPNQGDPRVLNQLGFANRKLGNMGEALKYYHAAVASNPDFSLVREYLGEAYIQLGQLEKAREQLTQIERICGGKACRDYSMLSKIMVESQLR